MSGPYSSHLLRALDRLWVASYSARQRCYHVETVAEMLRSGRKQFCRGGMTDYVPLAIVGSSEDALKVCDHCRKVGGTPGTADEAYQERLKAALHHPGAIHN